MTVEMNIAGLSDDLREFGAMVVIVAQPQSKADKLHEVQGGTIYPIGEPPLSSNVNVIRLIIFKRTAWDSGHGKNKKT